jgi:hypothetical protein
LQLQVIVILQLRASTYRIYLANVSNRLHGFFEPLLALNGSNLLHIILIPAYHPAIMALDAQSNWDVEMSQPIRIPIRSADVGAQNKHVLALSLPPSQNAKPSREIPLPPEIITHILEYLPRHASTQGTLWACTLVSRLWYTSSIALLYERPYLTGAGFNAFVQTICPSKNAHIRLSSLSILVKHLDMSALVHNSSRSLTARLLGRLKGHLEYFIAPQASFGISSFAALSKCTRLRTLNLSLISASIPNKLLFQTLKSLTDLEVLFFPRSSGSDPATIQEVYVWPPRMKALHLAGGIDDKFMVDQLSNVPECLEKLSIQHCTQVHAHALLTALENIGLRLHELTIRYPMPRLDSGQLDTLLMICPNLIALRVFAEYVTNDLLSFVTKHPLRILDVESTPSYLAENALRPETLYLAVEDDRLPDLRSVRVSTRLGWRETPTARQDVLDLEEAMNDHESENPLGLWTGVWQGD